MAISGLQIDINIRMCQEKGDNGVVAISAGGVQRGPSILVKVHVELGILPENILNHFHIAIFGHLEEFLFHCSGFVLLEKKRRRRRKERKRQKKEK